MEKGPAFRQLPEAIAAIGLVDFRPKQAVEYFDILNSHYSKITTAASPKFDLKKIIGQKGIYRSVWGSHPIKLKSCEWLLAAPEPWNHL